MTFTTVQVFVAVCAAPVIGLAFGHGMKNGAAYDAGYIDGRVVGWREHRDNPSGHR